MSGKSTTAFAVAFAISVLINLFLAGVIVGRITFPGFMTLNQAGLVPRQEVLALPEAERRAFVRVIRSHAPEIRPLRQKVRDAKRAAEQAIGAPTYDPKLLDERFAAVRQAQLEQGALQHKAIIEALGKLSPASRAMIAQRVEERAESAP